jgi:mRNA interferase MazF
MCDQARMLDLNSRGASFVEKAPAELTAEAVDIISGFIEIS